MKQEPGRRQPGITFLQGGENVKIKHREYLLSGDEQKAQLAADINRELEAANRKRWAAVLGAEHAN
jgi:hypothetical protein